jgi:hypothetical protein
VATSSSVAPGGKLMVLDRLLSTKACMAACMRTCSSALMSARHEYVAHVFGQGFDALAAALAHDLIEDRFARFGIDLQVIEGAVKGRAGVGEGQVFAVVVDVADVSQGEDRLAAVAFAAGHGGDGAGGGDGGLRGVADAVLADLARPGVPIQRGRPQSLLYSTSEVGGCHLKCSGRRSSLRWPGTARAPWPGRCWFASRDSARTPSPARRIPGLRASRSGCPHGTSGRPGP